MSNRKNVPHHQRVVLKTPWDTEHSLNALVRSVLDWLVLMGYRLRWFPIKVIALGSVLITSLAFFDVMQTGREMGWFTAIEAIVRAYPPKTWLIILSLCVLVVDGVGAGRTVVHKESPSQH